MKNSLNILTLVLGMVLAFLLTSCEKSEMLTNGSGDKENDALHIQLKYSVAIAKVNGVEYFFDCKDVHAVKVIEVPEIKTYSIIKLEGEKVTTSIHRKNWTFKDLGEIKTTVPPTTPPIKLK